MAELDQVQKAYTTILEHVIETGRAPHHTELAQVLGEPMLLRFSDEELLEKQPSTMVAHFNVPLTKWGEVTSSFN